MAPKETKEDTLYSVGIRLEKKDHICRNSLALSIDAEPVSVTELRALLADVETRQRPAASVRPPVLAQAESRRTRPGCRRKDDGDAFPLRKFGRLVDGRRVVLGARRRRPASAAHQAPGHSVVDGVLRVDGVVAVGCGHARATSDNKFELENVRRPDFHRLRPDGSRFADVKPVGKAVGRRKLKLPT